MNKRAFAVAAHPDDIEFLMAGTLILLRKAGYELHYMNIANGSCGSAHLPRAEIVQIRREESHAVAVALGAVYHESLTDDFEIFYEKHLLAQMGTILRQVSPEILLVQSPSDYMEDHQNAARLAVTAAFCRTMHNFPTDPPCPPAEQDVSVYYCQPFGNRDLFRQVVQPHLYVDITAVMQEKRTLLSHHQSQKEWLDFTQGMDSYLDAMAGFCQEIGTMSNCFEYAEGWRRRLHLGFCAADADPLSTALGSLVLVVQP